MLGQNCRNALDQAGLALRRIDGAPALRRRKRVGVEEGVLEIGFRRFGTVEIGARQIGLLEGSAA